ncbi:hypothetical protein [Teredinibacter franksiae]|uniref:hypothetical protein n=1 Tax=Teredinibacter franksiae TaxID=2761453 RepID=UPI001C8AD746|nr:hypothetical protein [Teredinibacter franksiae]
MFLHFNFNMRFFFDAAEDGTPNSRIATHMQLIRAMQGEQAASDACEASSAVRAKKQKGSA